jgi:hypothetical protein
LQEESKLLVATPAKFKKWFNVDVLENTEVTSIDRQVCSSSSSTSSSSSSFASSTTAAGAAATGEAVLGAVQLVACSSSCGLQHDMQLAAAHMCD